MHIYMKVVNQNQKIPTDRPTDPIFSDKTCFHVCCCEYRRTCLQFKVVQL